MQTFMLINVSVIVVIVKCKVSACTASKKKKKQKIAKGCKRALETTSVTMHRLA